MLTESEEVDFSTEIVSGENGEITIEPIEDFEEEVETPDELEMEEEFEEEVETETPETEVETETETEKETNTFEAFNATINGQEISIESLDEAKKLIENLSKPKPKEPNIWEQAQKELGVTTKDLALVSSIKGGDKDAFLFLAKEAGFDISQLIYDEAPASFDKDFTPTVQTEGQRIMEEISTSGELDNFTAMIESTDEDFIRNLADIQNLTAFRKQVASGKAAELMPLARKKAALENIPLFEAYAQVGHEQKKASAEKEVVKETTKKTPPIKKATKTATEAKVGEEDVWAMSDEDFDAKYGQKKI